VVGNSLRDQLLQAGLVDKSRAERAKKEQQKQARRQRGGKPASAGAERPAKPSADADKVARDRALNQQRNTARSEREIAAQVKQLVLRHRLPRDEGDDTRPYHFQNKQKIKRIHVSATNHRKLSTGELLIVNFNGNFELVPADVAEKIRQRNPVLVIDPPTERPVDADDPYAAYEVPDDLIW
jgi:uncharacterized protein YaiL (DUF2058 family)